MFRPHRGHVSGCAIARQDRYKVKSKSEINQEKQVVILYQREINQVIKTPSEDFSISFLDLIQ